MFNRNKRLNNYYHYYPAPVLVKEISLLNQPNTPLNQYQKVSLTINQNDVCSNQNNYSKQLQKISETDNLQIQEQLKLKIFDSKPLKVSNTDKIFIKSISNSINNLSLSSSNESNQSKREKSNKEQEKKRDKKRHRATTKPQPLTNKEYYLINEEINLRRSSRIKKIEKIKKHQKVMKIVEKVKNHNDINQMEITNNISNENVPIKEKYSGRRYSEIDSYDSISPKSNNNTQETEENSLSLANLIYSSSAYNKLLLDKAVNELGIIHSPKPNKNHESNIQEFEFIDENIYVCKKLVR